MSGVRHLTTKEAAAFLGISERSFYGHIRPLIQPVNIIPGKNLYRESDLEKLARNLEKGKI